MTKPDSGTQKLAAATPSLSNLNCTCDSSTGMATLSATLRILRTDNERVDMVEMLVNGSPSASTPTLTSSTPIGGGQVEEVYSWSDMTAQCGMAYAVFGRATVVLETKPESNTLNVNCPT